MGKPGLGAWSQGQESGWSHTASSCSPGGKASVLSRGWVLPRGPITPRHCPSFVSCHPGGGAGASQTCGLSWARGHLPSRPRAPALLCLHPHRQKLPAKLRTPQSPNGLNLSRFFPPPRLGRVHSEGMPLQPPLSCEDPDSACRLPGASDLQDTSRVELCFLCLAVGLTHCEEFSGYFMDSVTWLQTKASIHLHLISVDRELVVFVLSGQCWLWVDGGTA